MVSDVNIFAQKGLKLPRQKKLFLDFFPLCSLHLNVLLPTLPEVQCPNFLGFQNSRGKVIERGGLRFEYFCHKGCKIAAKKKG